MAAKAPARSKRRLARSFYDEALTEAERSGLAEAFEVAGVDQEIAVLRLRLRSVLRERPEDLILMLKGVELLARVVAGRYRLTKGSEVELGEALSGALASVSELKRGADVG